MVSKYLSRIFMVNFGGLNWLALFLVSLEPGDFHSYNFLFWISLRWYMYPYIQKFVIGFIKMINSSFCTSTEKYNLEFRSQKIIVLWTKCYPGSSEENVHICNLHLTKFPLQVSSVLNTLNDLFSGDKNIQYKKTTSLKRKEQQRSYETEKLETV